MSDNAPSTTEKTAPPEAEAAAEAHARLAAIVESSDDAIIGKDLNGVITSWNRGAERLFGYAAVEIVGQSVTVLIPPERHSEEAKILGHIRRGERVEHFETVRRRKDGTLFDVSLTSSPIVNGSGKIIGASKIARDISEHRRAEAALRWSEQRFRTAVSIVSSLIWTNTADGKMAGEQPGWGNFTGQRREEYQDYGWAKAVHPEDAQPTIDAWNQAVAAKRMFVFEHRLRRADGEWRLCSVRAVPLLGDKGEVLEWVGVHTDITEQKRSEDTLRRSEERLSAFVRASSDVVYRMNADWTEMGQLDGRNFIPDSAAASRTWLHDNLFTEDHPQVLAVIHEAIRTKSVFALEHRVRRVDGSEGWTFSRAVPILDANGEIVEWFGTASDMTERWQAEKALRASEAFKRSIIESSTDCIKVLDREGRLLSLESGQELLGIPEITPYLGTLWIDFWAQEDDRAAAQAAVAAAAAGGEGRFVGFFRTLHGSDKWWDVIVTPIRDLSGQPARLLAVSRDVSERRRADAALRASEERYRSLFEGIDEGFCVIEMIYDEHGRAVDYRFLETNPSFERHTGLIHAQGKTIRELAPEHEELWFETYGRIAATGELMRFQQHAAAVGRWFDLVGFRCGAPEQRQVAVLFTDITERRALEQALVARAEALAQADRSKDEFLAMLAHELRNPLAPLRNATELLKTEDASAEERTQANRIIGRQIENMSRMLDDLLDVSRITEGKIVLRKKPVDLERILTSAASLMRSTCAAQRQELGLLLPKEPVYVDADATRLEQVFGNLLSNACKYSGEGCHISISAELFRDAKVPEVAVTVRDDGAGIDPELLPRIFDLFVQASRTLDRAHGGLGIGLTLVQRLVTLHGGRIEAHSEGHGHGAQFVVHLPILLEAPLPEPTPPTPSVESSHAPSRRILVVDDNTDAARSLATLQQRRGHETRTAFTGPDALTAAAEFLPEVVLLDIGLPGMDGFEVARQIRAIPALTGSLLIAMSGYGREEDRTEAKLAGFDEYMVKPVDLDILRDWLHLGRRS